MSIVLGLVVLAILIGIISYQGVLSARNVKSTEQDFPDELSGR